MTRGHDGILQLFLPDAVWLGEASPELPAVRRQADVFWNILRQNIEGLAHVEVQTKPEKGIEARMLEYDARAYRRDGRPIYSILIYLRPTDSIPTTPFVMGWPGEPRLTFQYDIIRLWELPQEMVLALPFPDLWPIAGAMAGATIESVVAVGERIASTNLPRVEKAELAELLVTMATLQLPIEALLTTIRRNVMIEEIMRESGLYDYLLQEGKLKGRQEGELKGRQEGRLHTLREMAIEQITTHFPEADAALLDRVRAINDQGVLRRIVLKIDDAADLAMLISWLPTIS